MRPLSEARSSDLRHVRLVLTDMDDTLTFRGRLAASTYEALERLETAGVRTVPVTAAPAGWCDQMVRMWPVAAVIGENGGFCFTRNGSAVTRRFWLDDDAREQAHARLLAIAQSLAPDYPQVTLSDDRPFRLTSLAFDKPGDPEAAAALCRRLSEAGASVTVNSIWVLGWLGGTDKLKAARRFLPEAVGMDVDLDRHAILYAGDSANDVPMFAHFPKSAGVSTVVEHIASIPRLPTWITKGAGGEGFVEVADAILAARRDAQIGKSGAVVENA